MGEIIREATAEERKEYIELDNGQPIERRFKDEVAKYEQVATRNHMPFARNWAYDDFFDKKDELIKQIQRTEGEGATLKVNLSDFKTNWAKYSDPKNFEILDERPVKEEKLMDGMRVGIITGKNVNYKVKGMRYKMTVYVPLTDELTGQKMIPIVNTK